MSKKNAGRKSGAAGIAVVEGSAELDQAPEVVAEVAPAKPKRKTMAAPESNGNLGVSEIRKAAAFAHSIGGLDKAIALLQILKVAKEVQ